MFDINAKSRMHALDLPRRTRRLAQVARLAAFLATLAFGGLPAAAVELVHLRVPHKALGTVQEVSLEVNKSVLIDLPTQVGEVIASQPAVANVVMRTKTRAIVQGVSSGDTNVFFLDGAGNNIAVLDLKVYKPRSDVGNALEAAIMRAVDGASVNVDSVEVDDANGASNRIVLTGSAQSQDDLAKIGQMAAQFAGGLENVANLLKIAGNQQVKLHVSVAEVNREAVKQLGINLSGGISFGAVQIGLQSINAVGGASGVPAASGGISGSLPGTNFSVALRALERRGALRTLAEPTLTALSGQEASFLAGGEFPVPSNIDDAGNVSYAYKEFGVKLKFTPTVKSDGVIGLVIDTAVSEITTEGGFTLGGLTIPALKNRQAVTSVELPQGQTLAIAGMLQDTIRQQVNQLPGLGNIPILGALFRSRDFIHSQTELVVLVTPYLAQSGYDLPKPTDNMQIAGDAETIFLGHLEKLYGVGRDGTRGAYRGSVGFVLD